MPATTPKHREEPLIKMAAHAPHGIAAQMLGGSPSDGGRLHHDLYDLLSEIDVLAGNFGGELVSRQVIATVIQFWKLTHPGEKALGD